MIDVISLIKYILTGIYYLFSFITMFDKMNYLSNTESINTVLSIYESKNEIIKSQISENILVFKGKEIKASLILYPGANIDFTAYEPLMVACAEKGIMGFLFKMPLNFALLNIDAAQEIKNKFPEIKNWYIGGHSLGRVASGMYASKHIEEFNGLILLGSYTVNNFSKTNLKALSIYGSEDKAMHMNLYNMFKNFLLSDFKEVIIEGGCHSYFGMYGDQEGDGNPTITNIEQIRITAKEIAKFIEE